ncbi:MAG TPA: hypothetical protein VI318_17520 [Baekduia sp.]
MSPSTPFRPEDPTTTMSTLRRLRRLASRAAAASTLAVALAAVAGSAPALAADAFGPSDLQVSSSTNQAGAHPDVTTSFSFNMTDLGPGIGNAPVEPVKSIRLSLPAGLVGDAAHIPQCSPVTFGAGPFGGGHCDPTTQVGVVTVDADLAGIGTYAPMLFPVYNLAAGGGQPAAFGFGVMFPNVEIGFQARTATDGGLDTVIDGVNEGGRIAGQTLTLWGVPGDPSHDGLRCLDIYGGGPTTGCAPLPTLDRIPLLRNPTSCEPMTTTLSVDSWIHPGQFVTTTTTSPAPTGCDAVPFDPSVSVAPDTGTADAPTGLDVTVGVAQNRDPDGLSASDVRKTVVTLPEGYSISPSAADGLQACDDAGVGIGAAGPASCPDASKVGSATIVSPIIDQPLTGPIYLGPSTAPGHYRVYVVVEGSGVRLKLPGDIVADAQTGRLTTTFDNTPQQPFSSLTLHFDGGPRAVLASPASCGTADASAAIDPWKGGTTTLTTPVTLGGGDCGNGLPFAPSLTAGVTNATAGAASTTFALTVGRDDRTQGLGAISNVTLPAGLSAKVGSVPLCDGARAAAGTCGAESRVGRVDVVAGPGSSPLRLSGTAYLTEGYNGAPYGLSLVVPAVAGPYDLGTVVIRSAISVGPDARVSVQTDPLPQILDGIPLRLRSVGLTLDRPGFMVNPTSCADGVVAATLTGAAGTVQAASSRFGLTGCKKLAFAPKMKITASPSTKAAGAGLHVALTQGAGQANLKSVAVSLPKQLAVKLKALGTTCTAAQEAAQACPAASQVGGASARTPLLDVPLKGGVYLVQNGAKLPKLVAFLRGGGLSIPLEGSTAVSKTGRLSTTFATIPDVPITTFDLDLPHNKRQILETLKWPACGAAASVAFVGQNGARLTKTVEVTSKCHVSKAKK